MKKVFKQSVSFLLSFIMIVSVFTIIPVTVGAESSDRYDKVVAALTQLVDGDEERAKEIMESLHTSGLVDEDGNMVDLDVREDGRSVSLSELTSRINSGDKVGDITVNGNAATTDQVVQIQQVDSLLDIIQQIDTDVEITNEHVANFESLLEGIENGSIDLNNAIKSGALKMTSKKAASTDSTRNSGLKSGSGTYTVKDQLVNNLNYYLYSQAGLTQQQAKDDLQALCDAELIDTDGNFVEVTVLEESSVVDLNEVAERIENEESVGNLTVNDNTVTKEQIIKIRDMKKVMSIAVNGPANLDEYLAMETLSQLIQSGEINLQSFAEEMSTVLKKESGSGKVREVRFVNTFKVTDDIVDFLYAQLYIPSGFSRDQAQKDLQDLCDAGLIDWNGNFIALNVYENGQKANLDKLIERIEKGVMVGSLNVNGHAVTSVQIVKIQLVYRLMKAVAKHEISTTREREEIQELSTLLKSGKINLSWFAENMASFLIDKSSIGKGNVTDALSDALLQTFRGGFPSLNDQSNAKKYLQALYEALIIDANGNFIETYVKEADSYVSLEDVAQRIRNGDTVGKLAINGNAATPEQVAALQKMKKVMAFTQRYMQSGGSLGSVFTPSELDEIYELETEIRNGTVDFYAFAAVMPPVLHIRQTYPDTNSATGRLNTDSSGSYTAPYISGKNYEENHSFEKIPELWDNTWYSTEEYDGVRAGVVTFEFGDRDITSLNFIIVRLSEPQPVPVSFDWKLIPGELDISGSGTVTWEPGDTNDKKITIPHPDYGNQWFGNRGFVFTATSRQNAVFENGKTRFDEVLCAYTGSAPAIDASATHVTVDNISVPPGTYYTGDIIPVVVTLSQNVQLSEWATTTLTVNETDCLWMAHRNWYKSNKIAFGYTVKDADAVSITVSGLSNLRSEHGDSVTIDNIFPETTFDASKGVIIRPDVKRCTLDLDKKKYGISDDAAGNQVVTMVFPFKYGVDKSWVVNEAVPIGKELELPLPGLENGKTTHYLAGMYVSFDEGKTRYPVYVVNSSGKEGVGLAARFIPEINTYSALRRDTADIFYDPEVVVAETDSEKYLPAWKQGINDVKDACFSGEGKADAILLDGSSYSYYVKGLRLFEKTKYVERAGENFEVDNGFIPDGSRYVLVGDAAHPENQYDVEITAYQEFYNAVKDNVRAESDQELVLGYQISNREAFTYSAPKDFVWSSSNPSIAEIETDKKTGEGHIVLTGSEGKVKFFLTVCNGFDKYAYTLETPEITVLTGSEPFLNVPARSRIRSTLTNTDTDVFFSSNVTACNALSGKPATFTAKLYKVDSANDTPSGEPSWTITLPSTVDNTVSHITVPGDQIPDVGYYAVVIGTRYEGGTSAGVEVAAADFSATAYLNVKQAPAKVTFNRLESYYVDSDNIPSIGYTVTPASATVEYTTQKSGSEVSARQSASGGTIPFTAETPTGLKDVYIITVYARSDPSEAWSVDSMMLTVYNMDALDIIIADVADGAIGGTTGGTGTVADGTTVIMDNHDKLAGYGLTDSSFQLTYDDFTALRSDLKLNKIISANYGTGVWGLLSDKMQWSSSNPDSVSIDYKQGGYYADIRSYPYASYAPTTDFLLTAKGEDDDNVTITATHANTGKRETFTVKANTLQDELYLFRFTPKAETTVTYTNGAGEQRSLTSNEKGELAVYEPEGIKSSVTAMSNVDGNVYVGTIYAGNLVSGENDDPPLLLYPCNNLYMSAVSNATLTFLKPDGSAYNGEVTLRAGVYKNNIYCPDALIKTSKDEMNGKNGREDITLTVTNGKISLWFDPTQFTHNPSDKSLSPGDTLAYVIEYRFADSYQPGYVRIDAIPDADHSAKPTDAIVNMRDIVGSTLTPQIFRMNYRQFFIDEETGTYKGTNYVRSVMDFAENIGISMNLSKAELYTDVALPAEELGKDEKGYTTFENLENAAKFTFRTVEGTTLTGQDEISSLQQILNLQDLDDAAYFIFPFSSILMVHSVYTMTDENMNADGLTDLGDNPTPTARIEAVITRDDMTVRTITIPFGISNLSHRPDLVDPNNDAGDAAAEIKTEIGQEINVGQSLKNVNVNSMLKSGFAFLTGLSCQDINSPFNLMIIPTEDPGVFRIVVFIGYNQKPNDDEDGLSINLDPNEMYEDISSLIEEESSPVSFDFRFSGTIILEAGYNFSSKKWQFDFCGGSVGMGFSVNFEWSQNFFCGPVPAVITFEINGDADVKVSFINKAAVKSLLVDATIGISIEAFAGLGFDVTIAKLKLGIYGKIDANVNFLYLKKFGGGNSNGTKLDIHGEIGIRLQVKLGFIKYKKTFCSTGFNWTKKWGKYNSIQEQWENTGYAELLGTTRSGRAFAMYVFPDETALVAIDGGGELESREYLELYDRAWNGGANNTRNAAAMTNVQTNAYPDSNPVFSDDGNMLLYISDNDNAKTPESVVNYAAKNGSVYQQSGRIDTSEDNLLADMDVVASGTVGDEKDKESSVFAAWVKQTEPTKKKMGAKATYDDLGIMTNSTEIYVGMYTPKWELLRYETITAGGRIYNIPIYGSNRKWTVERLTDNTVADMAPTVASYGNKAIVAWRSLSASQMPEDGSSDDFTAMFNAENNINYRIGTNNASTGKVTWTDAKIAYNGASGTVNAIDSAMLSDGTSILVYTVRTGEDATSTETFYTVIDKNGNSLTTGRLTNDDCTDTNVQVTAVGNQFLVGWYSEYDADVKDDVKAHDIRMARINSDGSIDASFPESTKSLGAVDISSDFHFSSTANNQDINNVSIVWSQRKDSNAAEDSGKYELNAVRFFVQNDTVGVTAPVNIAETDQYFTIDQFDAYTDKSKNVHAIVLGSDYSSADGISLYDTIDLSSVTEELTGENSAEPGEDSLNVLEAEPVTCMKLAAGAFPDIAGEVTADTDISELMPGLGLPVQFTLTNKGTSVIQNVTVSIGAQSKEFTGLNLRQNTSTNLIMNYDVPEGAVQDEEYSVTSGSITLGSGTLTLNRPDVGISGMKLLRESDGTRDIQVILSNHTNIPLSGSGKTVKLALYKDAMHKNMLGEELTITDTAALADIDNDICSVVRTIDVTELYSGDEIPEEGLRVYAHAWVVDTDEPSLCNNDSFIRFKGLLTKSNGEKITTDAVLDVDNGAYTVYADIRNNSMQTAKLDSPVAVLLDSKGRVLAKEKLQDNPLVLQKEERKNDLSATFTAVDGIPAYAEIRFESQEGLAVIEMINALPAAPDVTVDDKDDIEAAREAYDALTDAQKALIDADTLKKLTDAEDALAAAEVTAMIDALPETVTVDDKDAVEAAREAYDALTDAQKAFISDETLAKLEAAEDALISEPVNLSYVENDTDAICLGDEVTVCGAAEGGKGEYTYAFYYKKSSSTKWLEMAPAYTTESASCTPAAMVHYDIKTVVKDARGVTTEKILTFKVKKPLSNDSTVSAEAIELGGDIVVTGAASGGTKGYTYAFYYKKSSRSNWHEMAEPYTTDSASCKPAATINYDIKVIVKDANGRTEEKTFTVKVNGPLVNKSEVVTTNAKVGEKISVKGAASGGAGGYTYAFYYKKSSKTDWYAMAPAYTTRHAAFKPAAAVSYDVKVIVKDAEGSTSEVLYTVNVTP